jgi:hypothetical protein
MGETALEEEPRGTLNIMIFLKINHLPIFDFYVHSSSYITDVNILYTHIT